MESTGPDQGGIKLPEGIALTDAEGSVLKGATPPPLVQAQKKKYEGIGGWLILPMLGLFLNPLMITIYLKTDMLPAFEPNVWHSLTDPSSPNYHHLWAPLLGFELGGNLFFLIFDLVLLAYFFRRSRHLPFMMVGFYMLNLLFVLLDHFAAQLIPAIVAQAGDPTNKEIAKSVLGCVIWVPYFLTSKRVKATFTR